jgi:hypothetical protein
LSQNPPCLLPFTEILRESQRKSENARVFQGIPGNLRGFQRIYLFEPCHHSSSPRIPEKYSLKVFSSLAFSANPREFFPGICSLLKALPRILIVPLDSLRYFQPPGIAEDWREDFSENLRYSLDISGNFSRSLSEILRESWRNYLSEKNSRRFPEILGESL